MDSGQTESSSGSWRADMGLGFGKSTSNQQSQQQVGIPQDVAGLRDAFFNQFLLPAIQGSAGAGGGLTQGFGSSLELINRALSDPNFASGQVEAAQRATAGAQRQQISDTVIPSVQEAGLLQGVGGGGSSNLQRIGQGAATVQGNLLPLGLQQLNRPVDQAFQLAEFFSNLFGQSAQGGAQTNILGASQGRSQSASGNVGLSGAGGGSPAPIPVL